MDKIKVLSWNIWIDGHFDDIADFLKKTDADIIGLQEVKDNDPKLDVIGYLSELGYEYRFAPVEYSWDGQTYIFGPAVFSKYKIESSEIFNLHDEHKRVAVRADIKVGDKVLHVFSTHLMHTHQQPSERQEAQVKNLIKAIPTDHSIVMGDFNATPESNAIQKMKEVLIDSDSNSLPTWSVYPAGCEDCNPQKIDTRLDYIFVTPDLRAHSFEVGESRASDHLPILVTVEL